MSSTGLIFPQLYPIMSEEQITSVIQSTAIMEHYSIT